MPIPLRAPDAIAKKCQDWSPSLYNCEKDAGGLRSTGRLKKKALRGKTENAIPVHKRDKMDKKFS